MLKAIYRWIGMLVFWLWLLGVMDLIDFRLCVGPSGSCWTMQPAQPAQPAKGTI